MPRNFCSNRVNLMKQFILSVMAIFAAVAIWVMYVPAAGPFLARVGVYDLIGLEPPLTEQNRAGGFGGGASRVIASEVTTGQVNSLVSAIGDGRAAQTVTIRSATSGIIRDMPVAPGTYVEAGALVAQFDDAAERIALERARLLVADANDEVDRLRQLGSSGSVAGATIRAAELALRTAELEVKQAEFDLEQRRITAPIGGWLGLLDAARGDRVGAQEPIAALIGSPLFSSSRIGRRTAARCFARRSSTTQIPSPIDRHLSTVQTVRQLRIQYGN